MCRSPIVRFFGLTFEEHLTNTGVSYVTKKRGASPLMIFII